MEENIEKTFVMIKPDGVSKKLIHEILRRFKIENLEVIDKKEIYLTESIAREHYAHVMHMPLYKDMESFLMSGPLISMIVIGDSAITRVRGILKDVRIDYGDKEVVFKNIMHASDSPESAAAEIKRFYGERSISQIK